MARRRLRRGFRGVSPIVASILLVAITVVSATVLYEFRPAMSNPPLSLDAYVSTIANEPAWGDGSECHDVNGVQTCTSLPAIGITFVDPTPVPLTELQFVFLCNDTVYISSSFVNIEWVPGTEATVGSGSGPQISHCGSFTPPLTMWNRVAFFEQLTPGNALIQPGDMLVFYAHTFLTFKDDDFHGAPEFCYSVPGACTLDVFFTGGQTSLVFSLDLYGFSVAS
jgi:flagellin-like protein